MVVERDRVRLFIYKWRGDKDNHIYKQHILLSLRVQLSEQLFRHSIQQHHLPVRWISSLFLSSQERRTWTWWHQNSYKEYSETHDLFLANVLEQYGRKKKNIEWFAVHSRLFSLLKVVLNKRHLRFFICFQQQAFIQAWVLVCRNAHRVKVPH